MDNIILAVVSFCVGSMFTAFLILLRERKNAVPSDDDLAEVYTIAVGIPILTAAQKSRAIAIAAKWWQSFKIVITWGE